jgi:hypothetical protein
MLSQCPACKKQIDVPPSVLGKKVRCSGCQAVFVAEAPPAPTVEEAPVDMLEVLQESPPKLKKEPPAKKPPPKRKEPESSLDFTGGDTAGPASDFGFVDSSEEVNPGVRLRASSAGAFLRYTGLYALLPTLLQTAYPIIIAVMTAHLEIAAIGCAPLLFYVLAAILIMIGARCLENMTSFALALTGAIFSIVMGLAALVFSMIITVLVAIALIAGGGGPLQIVAVVMALLTFIEAVMSIWGGIRAVIVSCNADVRAEMAREN